jgi:hypothetical protein
MPLNEADVVEIGEGCPSRARYRITEEDLNKVVGILDGKDGDNPFVVYKVDAIRNTLGGGTKASAGCISWYLNRIIADDEALASKGIYVHTHKGNIRFDRNSPTRQESEPP